MLIYPKKCEKCGLDYDVVLDECPNCHQHNIDIEKQRIPQNIFWLPIPLQIGMFLLGFAFAGLLLMASIYMACFSSIRDESLRKFVSTCFAYGTIFIVMLVIIGFNSKGIKKFLIDWKGYLWGLAFMALLFLGSYILAVIVENIVKNPNINQANIELYTKRYPAISIIVLGIIGPVVEECAYRMGLFSFLRRLNRIAAYVITIIVFSLIHFSFTAENIQIELLNLPSYLFGGLIFTIAYEMKGPMCSITAHVIYNVLNLSLIVLRK